MTTVTVLQKLAREYKVRYRACIHRITLTSTPVEDCGGARCILRGRIGPRRRHYHSLQFARRRKGERAAGGGRRGRRDWVSGRRRVGQVRIPTRTGAARYSPEHVYLSYTRLHGLVRPPSAIRRVLSYPNSYDSTRVSTVTSDFTLVGFHWGSRLAAGRNMTACALGRLNTVDFV